MIKENLNHIKTTIPNHVLLVAVSKTKPNEAILEAYDSGHRDFGENYVQELVEKQVDLPKDINWHYIGHLQSNKVKYIAPFVSLIHGVHNQSLLKEINKRAKNSNRIIPVLLQFHIAEEDTKSGFIYDEAISMLESTEFKNFENIDIRGVMGMATFTDDTSKVRNEFKQLKTYFDLLKTAYFPEKDNFSTISMGMSGDYEIAIEEGSTLIRVGSSIFGSR